MVRKKDDWIASLNDCPDSRANDHKDRVSSLMDGAITIPMIKMVKGNEACVRKHCASEASARPAYASPLNNFSRSEQYK